MKPFGAHQCKWVRVFLSTVFWGSLTFRAQALPDLIIVSGRAAMTVEYESRSFSTADCAYQEGCVRGGGVRKLLKLDAGIRNVGATDLVIGDPTRRPDLFVWSPCHGHYHMKGLATYRVLAPNG